MGKRELVLIALFVVIGVAVYQLTAPPAPPGSEVSVGGIFQRMKRGIQGPTASASGDSKQAFPVAAGIQTLRLNLTRPCDLTIIASQREDVSVEMHVVARGYESADAKAAAADAHLAFESTGADTVVITNDWRDRRDNQHPFISQAAITLTIPRRLRVSLLPHVGLLTVKDVASLDAIMSRGETHVTGTAGDLRLAHAGGTLEIVGAATLKLNARNSRGEVSGITGTTSIDVTGSRLRLSALTGPLEIESRSSDLTIEKIEALKPALRFNGNGGELRIDGLRTEARLDGHNTDIDVRLAAAAPVTIYNLGAIAVTAPPDGYTLDAVASEGRITSDDNAITATPEGGADARASAKVRGGGPALTLRATRGRIEIKHPAAEGK